MREEAATPGGLNEQSLRTLGNSEHFTLAEKVRFQFLSPSLSLSLSHTLSESLSLTLILFLSFQKLIVLFNYSVHAVVDSSITANEHSEKTIF
jgi:hypothetical protein